MATEILASVGIDLLFSGVYISSGKKTVLLKSVLSQNDITTAVLCGLEQAGRAIGFQNLHELLMSLPIIRLGTSIAQTGLLLHLGQPIGLLVSKDLIDTGCRVLNVLGLPSNMVIDIPTPDNQAAEEKIKLAYNLLLNQGARCIGVCLAKSWRNPMNEHLIRIMIERRYSAHHLGFVPIFISSDYEPGLSDEERIVALVIDCYMRQTVQKHINGIKTALAREGFAGVLLVTEGNGGLLQISRVRPSNVVMANKAALFSVARYWFEQVGMLKGIALEIGSLDSQITIMDERINSDASFLSLPPKNIGGVSSTLKLRNGRFVLTTPNSFPVLWGNSLNWNERAPSLLDAMLVVGYINPIVHSKNGSQFDRAGAYEAMDRLIGHRSGMIEAAALRACNDVADDIAHIIRRQIKKERIDPSKYAFLVCGETGGVLACAIAERLDWEVIYTIPGSNMILTIGALMMEFSQQFRYRLHSKINIQDPLMLQSIINRLKRQSERILRVKQLNNLPVFYRYGIEYMAKDSDAVQYLHHEIKEPQLFSTDTPMGGLPEINDYETVALTLQLTGTLPKASSGFRDIRKQIFEMSPVSEQKRQIYLGTALGWNECPVYWLPDIDAGEVLPGPVLIEAVDSVYWVPSGWHYVVGTKGVDWIEREVRCEGKDN